MLGTLLRLTTASAPSLSVSARSLAPQSLADLTRRLLQSGREVEVTLHTGLLLFTLGVIAALLGLYISYQAYRGYRRNSSKPMLYLSAGIVMLTFVPTLLTTVAANVPPLEGVGLLLGMVARIVGLLSILYAIRYA